MINTINDFLSPDKYKIHFDSPREITNSILTKTEHVFKIITNFNI